MLDIKKTLEKVLYRLNITKDYVTEQRLSANNGQWSYRKWASGRVECWMALITTGTWGAWGNIFSHDIPPQSLPFTFNSYYHYAVAKCQSDNSVAGINVNGGNATQSPGLTLVRGTNSSGTKTFISWYYTMGTIVGG